MRIAAQKNQVILLCVLLLLSLGCDQSRPFPALTAPTETDGRDPTVFQADGQGLSQGEPSPTPYPTALSVSRVGGQDAATDEFATNEGVPFASLSGKAQQAVPAVVRINTNTGSGSGVIAQTLGNTGYVVTNHHVVQGANRAQVTVKDGPTYQGEVLGEDAVRDLAVLKICCDSFQSASFGDVGGLEPGMDVMVIGYPRDIPGSATITRGIVSAIRFNTTLQSEVIQTDAATNPGNSGGPIVSLGGEVLGIMTFKYMDAEGLGFAVPSDAVLQQLPALWATEQPLPSVPYLVSITKSDPGDDELTRRIEEAIQELIPTPAPTPSPTPRPTRAVSPTPKPAATSTLPPPTPDPTWHPCALAEIPPPEELQLTYARFMAADPYTNSVNSEMREVLARQFPEIAASYTLEFLNNPLRYASFRDYLGQVGYQPGLDSTIRADFQALRQKGLLPNADKPFIDYFQGSDPCTLARILVFDSDELMTLLAVEIARSGYSPLVSDAMVRITIRDIHAFRDRDPATPLIYFILEMDDSAN